MFNTPFRIVQGSPWQRFYCYTVRVTSTCVNSAYHTLNLSIRYPPLAGCTFTEGQWFYFRFFRFLSVIKIVAVILKIIWKLRYTTITHQHAYILTGFDSSDFIRHNVKKKKKIVSIHCKKLRIVVHLISYVHNEKNKESQIT